MFVLGIESTAHTFGVGIVSLDGEILANEKSVYVPEKGGIHPREAAQHHSSVAASIIKKALEKAEVDFSEISAISVALGPGLGPCLRTGATVARFLSLYYDIPLVPVNHCIAHVEIGRKVNDLEDPLVVYVSGGSTMVLTFVDGKYRVLGETLDIALGNMQDTFALRLGRKVGLKVDVHPVEALAAKATRYISLPYVVKGQDLSFSGLLTAAEKLLEKGYPAEDVCYSLLETAFSMLCEVTERALAHTKKEELLLTGGVARSPKLQKMLKLVAETHGAKFAVVPPEYATDNGAMIAWTGFLAYKHGVSIRVEESFINPKWRPDEVEIPWR